jgi:hypothetical protein
MLAYVYPDIAANIMSFDDWVHKEQSVYIQMNDEAQVMKSDMVALSDSVHPSVHGKGLAI